MDEIELKMLSKINIFYSLCCVFFVLLLSSCSVDKEGFSPIVLEKEISYEETSDNLITEIEDSNMPIRKAFYGKPCDTARRIGCYTIFYPNKIDDFNYFIGDNWLNVVDYNTFALPEERVDGRGGIYRRTGDFNYDNICDLQDYDIWAEWWTEVERN